MTLVVVPSERHVERVVREGTRAETRTSLRTRLAAALLPDVRFADPRETRLALAMALWPDTDSPGPGQQLDLFGAAAPRDGVRARGAVSRNRQGPSPDPVLTPLRRRGGASWVRLVESVDAAIGLVRARGATALDLERVGQKDRGVTSSRARALALAMRALDEVLARSGARDGRLLGRTLADAIAGATPTELARHVGAKNLRARWLLSWDHGDLAWWRALEEKLTRLGGGARVALPSFDRRLEGSRERDPLEILAEDLAKGLDGAPETEAIAMPLGDLAGAPPDAVSEDRASILRAQDPAAQGRAVAAVVRDALAAGASVERVVVAVPSLDERTLGPLRRAIEDRGIVAYEARGAPPSQSAVVVAALLALEAAASLDRKRVARLLRSGFIDATRLVPDAERREAERAIARIARALESTATAQGTDAAERLVATATATATDRAEDRDAMRAVARATIALLVVAHAPKTRGEHLRAARALWTGLGIGARAGRGGLAAFGRDEPLEGVPRAERLAIARDARAWEALVSAVDAYESVAHAAGALEQAIDADMFRLELAGVLDAGGATPGAGRAGAIRITRLADVAGDDLDLLVVIDVNEGIFPRDFMQDAIVSDALEDALARTSRGSFSALGSAVARARELAALATAAADAARVVLSFTSDDGAGGPLEPSFIVDVLLRAGVRLDAGHDAHIARGSAAGASTAEDIARRASRETAREAFFLDPARPLSDLSGDLTSSPHAIQATVTAIVEGETGASARALSVTGLERFARCPFMGYAHVVLAAREAERQEELPDAREEGTLVHEALAAAFVATIEEWPRRPRSRSAIVTRGLAAADEILARATRHAPLGAVARLRVRDAVSAMLARAIDDDEWDFALAEQSFGGKGEATWPALALAEDHTRLALRGTIDRVDRAHDGSAVRVIDYKRGKSTVRAAAAGVGVAALQVPIYACVASRRFDLPAKGLYAPTQPRDLAAAAGANAKAERRMDELVHRPAPTALAEIERRALTVVRAVRSGRLTPTPADEATCRTCSVSGGCRKPRFAMTPEDESEEPPA